MSGQQAAEAVPGWGAEVFVAREHSFLLGLSLTIVTSACLYQGVSV